MMEPCSLSALFTLAMLAGVASSHFSMAMPPLPKSFIMRVARSVLSVI